MTTTELAVLSWESEASRAYLKKVVGLEPFIIPVDSLNHLRFELHRRGGTVVLSTHGTDDGEHIGPGGRHGFHRHDELALEKVAAETLVVLACYQRRERWAAAPARVHTYSELTTPGNYRPVLAHLLAGNRLTRDFTDALRPGGASPYRPLAWEHPSLV